METTEETVRGFLAAHLPADWFEGRPELAIDRDELTVVGTLPVPVLPDSASGGASDEMRREATAERIRAWREQTREQRMAIARAAEHRFGRKLAWGARCGDQQQLFTSLSVPVMTRLRQPERRVLDTLVAGGAARSRADALAWCVRLVAANAADWLADLRAAMAEVERVRHAGPTPGAP